MKEFIVIMFGYYEPQYFEAESWTDLITNIIPYHQLTKVISITCTEKIV